MAQSAKELFVMQYDKAVKDQYSENARLRKKVRVKDEVQGEEVRFQLMDQVVSVPKNRLANMIASDPTVKRVTCKVVDYATAMYSETFDQAKINYSEKNELSGLAGKSIARREDQIIIDAFKLAVFDGGTDLVFWNPNNTTGLPDGLKKSNSGTDLFRILSSIFNFKNIPDGERYVLLSAAQFTKILEDENVITFDSNTVKALVEGKVVKWLGIKIQVLGYMPEGGLFTGADSGTIAAAIHNAAITTNENIFQAGVCALAWGKQGVGLGVGCDLKTEVNYIPEKTSHLIASLYSAGAIIIDPRDIIIIVTDVPRQVYV